MDRPTGLFFAEQTVDSLIAAVVEFENKEAVFLAENCRQNALRFTAAEFRRQFMAQVYLILDKSGG